MVSLSRSYNTNSGGATFFSESVNMDDRELLQPVLDSFGGFAPVRTAPLFVLHLVLLLVLDAVALAPFGTDAHCTGYFVVIYLHVALWFITFAMHLMTKRAHHQVRLNGYLEFYKDCEGHTSLPLIAVSLWTVALLFVQTLTQQDDFVAKCVRGGPLSPRAYLGALVVLESVAVAGINILYIRKVARFNRQQAPPDVLKREWLSSANPETFSQNEVGYREMGGKVYDFLEKQADLIRYLKEHNARLAQKVMALSEQLRSENP